jgi:hypothetical protein
MLDERIHHSVTKEKALDLIAETRRRDAAKS